MAVDQNHDDYSLNDDAVSAAAEAMREQIENGECDDQIAAATIATYLRAVAAPPTAPAAQL